MRFAYLWATGSIALPSRTSASKPFTNHEIGYFTRRRKLLCEAFYACWEADNSKPSVRGFSLWSAIQTGGISGVVTDQSGRSCQRSHRRYHSEGTGKSVRTLTTGDDGAFTTSLLPPGMYRVEVTAPNFKKAVVAAVQVSIPSITRQDISHFRQAVLKKRLMSKLRRR